MRILTYQKLDQKKSLLPLMEQAFGWPFDPFEFDKNIKADPRLRDSGVGFCAVTEDKTVAYVGVMDLQELLITKRKEWEVSTALPLCLVKQEKASAPHC
jgi:hypothetical protein